MISDVLRRMPGCVRLFPQQKTSKTLQGEGQDMSDTVLSVRGAGKFFPGVKALEDVDFDLERGEIHALLGENGAGKSTLIKVITGVHPRDAGTVSLDGQEIHPRRTRPSSSR